MKPLLTTSFDRYARYDYLWRLRREAMGPAPISILDVGDPYGTIAELFPDDRTVSVDIYGESPSTFNGHQHVIGSGFQLPFADGSFDLVAAHDVLEHLPDDRRGEFFDELLRVGRGPVLVVAPFADPRTTRCEDIVNAYYVARFGHGLVQLDEHAECGLPDLDAMRALLDDRGVEHKAHGDGWLYHWLPLMLVKGHNVSEGNTDLDRRMDTIFNTQLRTADRRGPHYRRAIVMRPPADNYPDFNDLAEVGDVDGDLTRLTEVGWEIAKALPKGETPDQPGSSIRRWIDRHRGDEGPLAVAAKDLMRVLDGAVELTAAQPFFQHAPAGSTAAGSTSTDLSPTQPRVAVILVNLNSRDELMESLDSLAVQTYPRELLDVVVVDNASTDGSADMLATDYAWVRVLQQDSNTGFSPAVNVGARAVDAECIVLLNNDARVDPDFVERLIERYDPATGAVCVGAQIVSWDGERLDFGEGAVNFYGMGQQIGYGMPAASGDTEDGKEILFACGGAMLVNRQTFLDTGGFDDAFFAYFEDVDFGWRLWILGYRVVFAAKARAYHKMHGTSSRFPPHQRFLLYERNALRTLLKNYDDVNLHRVLGPALMLLIMRTLMRGGGLNRPAYTIGGDRGETEQVDRLALAHLHAVGDIVADFDLIMASRATIQRGRKRGDDEVLAMFGRPFWPVLPQREYAELQERLVNGFGLDDIMPKARASRVLIIANDPIAEKMSGPAIRAWEIAKALAGTAEITVAVPVESTLTAPGVTLEAYADELTLFAMAQSADVILVQGYTIRKNPSLKRVPAVLVVDLYDPWLFENIELHTNEPTGDAALANDVTVLNELLDEGDFFICASERQRDYWIGMLGGRDRLTQGQYTFDPTLRMLIDVVPFGLPDRAPKHIKPVLKGVHPAIAADDLVVLWGGGTWDWFDPLSVIDAFKLVIAKVPNAKLYFLGFQLESSGTKVMRVAAMAKARAEELGLAGTSVIFGDWAPYDLREAYLLEADVAVTAVRDLAETRLSFRTRVLDYLWAKLPVVSTEGDVLSDLVRDEHVGIVVPPGNAPALAAAMVRLLQSPALRANCAANAGEVAKRFTWQAAVSPLRHVIAKPWQWDDARGLRPRGRRLTEETRALMDDKNRALGYGMAKKLYPDIPFANAAAYVNHLETVVQLQKNRLDVLRKTPIYPAFVAAKKVRQWQRDRQEE